MSANGGAGRHDVRFPGGDGTELAGTLERPAGEPLGVVLFAHCFTCDRRSFAASRISRSLAGAGFAVLRFDFTGLGESDGEFADTSFTSNLDDLVAAADWLTHEVGAPGILVGHSLGGAAVVAVAGRLESVEAVAVVGAPSTPAHVQHLLDDAAPAGDGHLEVTIGNRALHISAELSRDLAQQPQLERIAAMKKPLLVLHSPVDEVVGVEEARAIFEAARHPKSFVALDGADHLLSRPRDAAFAAGMIATWAVRYLDDSDQPAEDDPEGVPTGVLVTELSADVGYAHRVASGQHSWLLDEPEDVGGGDTGPGPYEMLLSSLGACTSMTMRMYARRKGWEYGATRVVLRHERIHAEDCANCETSTGRVDRLHRHIELDPALPAERREALLKIADRCPVHRTLLSEIDILTTSGSDGD